MMLDNLYAITHGLNRRYPNGNDPFQMMTRLMDVLRCGVQVAIYYGIEKELEDRINDAYKKMNAEGLI